MSDAYFIQVWVRCEHPGCDAMVDLMLNLDAAVYHRSLEIPPGWSHRRNSDDTGCYTATALCPKHGDPCIHALEQQKTPESESGGEP